MKNMMANRSIRYADYECGDVPRMTIIKVSFSLSDEVKRYGKQLILDALANSNTNDRAKKKIFIAKLDNCVVVLFMNYTIRRSPKS